MEMQQGDDCGQIRRSVQVLDLEVDSGGGGGGRVCVCISVSVCVCVYIHVFVCMFAFVHKLMSVPIIYCTLSACIFCVLMPDQRLYYLQLDQQCRTNNNKERTIQQHF